jgi:hypothetical protein
MTKKFDKLNEVFNVDQSEIITVENTEIKKEIEQDLETISKISDDIKKDYNYSRGNLYSLIEKGQEAINGILELAQESDMPRAYEVAGQLIKNTGEIAEKLLNLQKMMKDIEEDKTGPTTVNNALFVGSTTELAKLLKQQSILNQKEQ